MVKLILIRHAESVNNVDKGIVGRAWKKFKSSWSLPTASELSTVCTLLTIPMDSDLSPDGITMVAALRAKLDAMDFCATYKVGLIVHSSLLRARKTCEGLFGGGGTTTPHPPINSHPDIFEKDIGETLGLRDMGIRVERFIKWTLALPPEVGAVVVVSHSAFFRCLLRTDVHMQNCEVRLCEFATDGRVVVNESVLLGGPDLLQ